MPCCPGSPAVFELWLHLACLLGWGLMGLGAPSPPAAPCGLCEQYLYPENFRTVSFLYLHLFGIKKAPKIL